MYGATRPGFALRAAWSAGALIIIGVAWIANFRNSRRQARSRHNKLLDSACRICRRRKTWMARFAATVYREPHLICSLWQHHLPNCPAHPAERSPSLMMQMRTTSVSASRVIRMVAATCGRAAMQLVSRAASSGRLALWRLRGQMGLLVLHNLWPAALQATAAVLAAQT